MNISEDTKKTEAPEPSLDHAAGSVNSMYSAWVAFVDVRRDRLHEFPTYEDWILSDDLECLAFRQGWTARGAILRDPNRYPDPIDFPLNDQV